MSFQLIIFFYNPSEYCFSLWEIKVVRGSCFKERDKKKHFTGGKVEKKSVEIRHKEYPLAKTRSHHKTTTETNIRSSESHSEKVVFCYCS